MKIIIYSTKSFEKQHIKEANQGRHELYFIPETLTLKTVGKAKGYAGVSCLVSNYIDEQLMAKLSDNGVKYITLRSEGYDYAQGAAAKRHNKLLLESLNTRHKQLLDLRCA